MWPFKQYDTREGLARCTFHNSFYDPVHEGERDRARMWGTATPHAIIAVPGKRKNAETLRVSSIILIPRLDRCLSARGSQFELVCIGLVFTWFEAGLLVLA